MQVIELPNPKKITSANEELTEKEIKLVIYGMDKMISAMQQVRDNYTQSNINLYKS